MRSASAENLHAGDERLRFWSIHGLKRLDTKEARRLLWEARSHTLATELETEAFHRSLNEAV